MKYILASAKGHKNETWFETPGIEKLIKCYHDLERLLIKENVKLLVEQKSRILTTFEGL